MAIKNMSGQLAQAGDMLSLLSGQVSGNTEQLSEIAAQVNRVARIQYKTGQETQEKLALLHADLESVRQWQVGHEVDAARLRDLEQQNDVVAGTIMNWLDDIDRISTGLQDGEQETWRQLLERWAGQLLQALAELGVYELDLLGATFDPQWAESIGTIERDPAWNQSERFSAPYAVVEVARRGFASRDGQLLRKAQVITVREESPAEKHGENNSDGRIRDENNIYQRGNNYEESGNENDGDEDDGENNNSEDGKENNGSGKSSNRGWLSLGPEGGSGS